MKIKPTWFIVIGAVLFLFISNIPYGRESMPVFDKTMNNFRLTLVDHSDHIYANDIADIKIKIKNTHDVAAGMFVQCSIFDRNWPTFGWLRDLSRTGIFNEVDDCKPNEPFTQTARIEMQPKEEKQFTYSVKVPDTIGGDNVIYCSAYERCWQSETVTGLESDHLIEKITVERKPNGKTPALGNATIGTGKTPNLEEQGDTCIRNTQCSFLGLGAAKCINGHCVDKEDLPEESDFEWPKYDDSTIKEWASQHKVILMLIAFASMIIGLIMVYKEPKEDL